MFANFKHITTIKIITTLFALLLLFASQGTFAQRTITGKVISGEDGLAMPGVRVEVKGTRTGTATDSDGNFTLDVPNDATIVVSFMGFKSVEMTVGNLIQFTIILQPDVITLGPHPFDDYNYSYNAAYSFFTISLQVDFLRPSFNSFEPLLGKENIDNLKYNVNVGLEYAFSYNRFHFALNHGHVFGEGVALDTLRNGKYKIFLLGTHFGYNVINSKGFLITPKVGVKWYRHRMINYDSQHSIPIEQYIGTKDLDIRFNHLIGFAGISCSYVFYLDYLPRAVGFYGGYAFKLNDKPWVYSGNNRLITDKKVEFGNLNFGITLSVLLFNNYF